MNDKLKLITIPRSIHEHDCIKWLKTNDSMAIALWMFVSMTFTMYVCQMVISLCMYENMAIALKCLSIWLSQCMYVNMAIALCIYVSAARHYVYRCTRKTLKINSYLKYPTGQRAIIKHIDLCKNSSPFSRPKPLLLNTCVDRRTMSCWHRNPSKWDSILM